MGKNQPLKQPSLGGHREHQAVMNLVLTRNPQMPKVGRTKRARLFFGFLEENGGMKGFELGSMSPNSVSRIRSTLKAGTAAVLLTSLASSRALGPQEVLQNISQMTHWCINFNLYSHLLRSLSLLIEIIIRFQS